MGEELPFDRNPATADYRAARAKCTKKAACGRDYVLVSKLSLWLKSMVYPEERTHAGRLLAFAYRNRNPDKPRFPIAVGELFDSRVGCILVFCVLLELGCGDLIHEFLRHGIYDDLLPIDIYSLREKAASMRMRNSDAFANAFDRLQWKFCPATIEMGMGREFHENQILPFCQREKVNEKGVHSQLWQVAVPEEFVGPMLRAVIKDKIFNNPDDDYGPRYNFAVKAFNEGNKTQIENEKNASIALRHHAGIVQYFGDYRHPDAVGKTLTSNVIMEYADYDLDEYFAEFAPPVSENLIKFFWADLFEIAHAVNGIHNLRVDTHGRMREFSGWHANIDPDNILIVHGKFKLAGLSSVAFLEKAEAEPKNVVGGGRETFSAPERYPRIGNAVSQAIDIWSLGCVFSIAATWVVLGHKGIRQYANLRQTSIGKVIQARAKASTSSRIKPQIAPGEYFHDGENVLANVFSWHEYLRSVVRRSDVITGRVLDIVEQGMIVGDAGRRINAKDLCTLLDQIKAA
ncbi:hypothetical protein VF21_07968 [Pseudogymnoascus sp. 05NY08]|nr:hypothetical protein VF21_07968 [Pseudogymnoascus sp. 05NY08]